MNRVTALLPTHDDATDLGFAAALAVLAIYAFKQSYGGQEFLVVGAIGVALGCLVAHVGNRLELPALFVVAALFIVYVVVGGAVALRDRAIAGVLPSPDTMLGALDATVSGWKQLLTTVPPVGRIGNLMALPMLSGIVAGGGAVLWANRLRALIPAVLAPTAVMVLGLLCGLDRPVSTLLHGAVFAALVVVWMALRHRRARPVVQQHSHARGRRMVGSVALIAVASACGVAVGPKLPFARAAERVVLRDKLEPPFDPFDYPSPLSGYRDYVKTNKDTVLFTISGLPSGVPIRMATMDDYDGLVWRATGGVGAASGASGFFRRVGTHVAPEYPGERATITIEVRHWTDVWIPTVGEVVEIRFKGPRARALADAYRYNSATDTAASQQRLLQPGDIYELDVVLPPTAEQVKNAPLLDLAGKSSSNAIPEELVSWAAPQVAKVERSHRPTTLELSLQQRGVYSDGDTPEQQASLGGHSAGRMKSFIAAESPVGDAEQFASALGLMLRGDDIAARVVSGFKPRSWHAGVIDVTGFDAEAWVEVPIEGVGWTSLFPTPKRDHIKPDTKPKPKPQPERNTQVPPPPPVLAEDPRTDPAKEAEGKKDDKKKEKPKAGAVGGGGLSRQVVLGLTLGGPPLLFIGGTSAVIVGLKARRRRRRRVQGSTTDRISNGWRELMDAARDLGRPVPDNATRSEVAGFVGTQQAPALASGADTAVFGPVDSSDDDVRNYWDVLSASIHDLRHQVGVVERLKARLSLTSLRRTRVS